MRNAEGTLYTVNEVLASHIT